MSVVDPRYSEHYEPKRVKRKKFRRFTKRKKLMRPRQWPVSFFVRDIDFIKFENLHGGFCACGARVTEFCHKCLDSSSDM